MREHIDDKDFYKDMNYCIKMISSGKLYEANIDSALENDEGNEALNWVRNFGRSTRTKQRASTDAQAAQLKQIDNFDVAERLSLSTKAQELLKNVSSFYFDPFEFMEATGHQELVTISTYLMNEHQLFGSLKIIPETFIKFMTKVQGGYNNVSYHNKTHATDVCQNCYYFCMDCEFKDKAKLTDIDMAAIIVATSCHDYEHFGFNNAYLIETQHEIAIRYNDISVLESHHIGSAFRDMKMEGCGILDNFSKEDRKEIRKKMIDMVLATDMAKHFDDIGQFKNRSTAEDFDPADGDKTLCLQIMIHLSDLNNPTKPWKTTLAWTGLLYIEFFHQGDMERDAGRPISMLMDRETVNIAKS